MITSRAFHLARTFLTIFLRDRQAMFFGLFFPVIFLTVLGFMTGQSRDPIDIGIANHSPSPLADELVAALSGNPLFKTHAGDEKALKDKLAQGETTMVLVIPQDFSSATEGAELVVYVDAAQVRLLGLIIPAMKNALLDIERKLRHTEPLFSLKVEDVEARSQRYIDFLLPGVLAFSLMQISVAGSGFNIVEYRRKGILKRLFVTPLKPAEFIAAICMARLVWCLIQLSVLLLVALYLLKVNIVGNFASLYLVVVLGTIIFLCIGFCVGSVAKTQQGVGAVGNIVIFPQLFLSGVFFPIQLMPDWIQPVARLLPLSYVVDSLRGICNDGAGLVEIWPSLAGVFAWILLSFLLATRLFSWKEIVR